MSKAKEAEAPAKILKYMLDQNRPYSAIDILTNLHKEFGKTCVQRTLDQLVAEGKLVEKTYGKQKIYVANQSHFPDVDEAELKQMEKQITELQDEIKKREVECRTLESELASLQSSLTSEEAREQLQATEKQCSEMEAKLNMLKSGKNSVAPKEAERIHKAHNESTRLWRKRKRMATEIVNAVLEGYQKSKRQLYEEVGFETDEEYGVTLPS